MKLSEIVEGDSEHFAVILFKIFKRSNNNAAWDAMPLNFHWTGIIMQYVYLFMQDLSLGKRVMFGPGFVQED